MIIKDKNVVVEKKKKISYILDLVEKSFDLNYEKRTRNAN
jgi:hypothetical protein